MQVFFAAGAKRDSLKSEGLTLLYYKKLDLCYARKYFVPPKTEHNIRMGSIFKHLAAVWKSTPVEFKEYFQNYAVNFNAQYRTDKYPLNGYACFTKMMFDWRKQNPELDLTKLTWEDVLFGIINRDIHDEEDGEAIINGIEWEEIVNGELLMVNVGKDKTIFGEISIDNQDEQDGKAIINVGRKVLAENMVEEICLERVEPG